MLTKIYYKFVEVNTVMQNNIEANVISGRAKNCPIEAFTKKQLVPRVSESKKVPLLRY